MPTLDKPCTMFRSRAAVADDPKVDRSGGMFGAGLISDIAIITQGEAAGHGGWIDAEFAEMVAMAVNTSPSEHGGVKARLTHPGLSADGISDRLGRVTDAYVAGTTVYGDLHLMDAAHRTPDGDKASYVMDLAEQDPDSFGMSIVFERDIAAEEQFFSDYMMDGEFESPDERNTGNLPHFRLARLRAADVVDDPAANPDGLFSSTQTPAVDAEALLSYICGLTDKKPETQFGVDPSRVARFFADFLERHELQLQRKPDMATATESAAQVAEDIVGPTREEFAAELSRFTKAFGPEHGVAWFAANLDFDTASVVYEAMADDIRTLTVQVEDLQNRLAALDTGDADPITAQDSDNSKPARTGMAGKIRLSGKRYENN